MLDKKKQFSFDNVNYANLESILLSSENDYDQLLVLFIS